MNEVEQAVAAAVAAERKRIAQATLDYEEGCEDGKIAFLEEIGLEDFIPKREYEFTFTVTIKGTVDRQNDHYTINEDEADSVLRRLTQDIENRLDGEMGLADYRIDVSGDDASVS